MSASHFFRDRVVWERVAQAIVPRVLARKAGGGAVRVWSAGCATGEEAYTLAMLFAEAAAALPTPPAIQIFGTDLDEEAIARARSGWYSAAETTGLSPERLDRHFVKDRGGFRIRPELRQIVLFAHHDLIEDPPFSRLDFVSCRNVLTDLDGAAQKRAMEALHFALAPGCWLLLGSAESVEAVPQRFAAFDEDHRIYESRAVRRVPLIPAGSWRGVPDPRAIPGLAAEATASRFAPIDLHQRLLEDYAPPSLVVDEQYTIVHLSNRVVRFVHFAPGDATLGLLQVVRPDLRDPLRTALAQAAQQRKTVVVPVSTNADPAEPPQLQLIVRPVLREGEPPRGYFLVLFDERADTDARRPVSPAEPVPAELAEEVVRLRSQMQAKAQQYEGQAEEASAANEELQAINEELRSTAEELETGQEELHSLNEELQRVNQELTIRIEEITHANDDTRNVMTSTEIGTMFIDRNLHVKLFTPRIRDVFNLIDADVGRSLLDITNKLMIDDLAADVAHVLERSETVAREVQTRDGRWHLMRLLPYRAAGDHFDGTVLTFVDVTERKRADDVVREVQTRLVFLLDLADRLRAHTEAIPMRQDAAAALARHFRVRRVRYLEVEDGEVVVSADSASDASALPQRWPADALRPLLPASAARADDLIVDDVAKDARLTAEERAALAASGAAAFVRMMLDRANRGATAIEVQSDRPRRWTDAEVQFLRVVADRTWDAVERARAEVALRQSEERHRIIVDSALDYAIITVDLEGRITSWSPGAEAALGWTAAEAYLQPLAMTFVPEDRAAGVPERERREARENGVAPDVRWHLRKDDTRVFIDGITRALKTPNGELQGYLKIGRDDTVRRRTVEALRDSEARLQAVTSLVPDLLWSNDASGASDWYNQRWLDYTGQSFAEAVGFGWLDAIHPDDRERSRAHFQEAIHAGDRFRHELRIRSASGEYRWFLLQAEPLRDPAGQIVRWFGAAMDVHQQRVARDGLEQRVRERTAQLEELSGQRQQLLERLVTATEEERRRIARELHDELGQHITALRVGLHEPSVESRPRLDAIVQRLDQTIDRLTLELRPPVLDHLGLHGAIGSLAEACAAASGLRIDVHLPAVDGARFSEAIETTIYRVTQEALTNVMKHASASTVSVIVEREGDALRIIVEDDGEGFDGEGALRGTAARGRFGLLGMRERLALVGGSLAIESEPGSGTAIYARVPLIEPAKPS